jgi:hypothetical protein
MELRPETEPTKPSKLGFVGFDGSSFGENFMTGDSQPQSAIPSDRCPYNLPEGLQLVSYTRKEAPIPVTVCSVVTDVPKFICHVLGEIEARLHRPTQMRAGDSVFELLSKLADCGLELRLEQPVPKGS